LNRIWIIARTVSIEMVRRKDVYVLLILLAVLLYALLSVNAFGLGANIRYVMDLGLLMVWLFSIILCIGLSCRQLPREEESGTIYPLLAKPVTRGELLSGKWAGSWFGVALATTIFYMGVAGVVGFCGGAVQLSALTQAWILHLIALGAVAALGIALSTRFSYGAAATLTYVFLGASFVVVPRIPFMLAGRSGPGATALLAVYYVFPHFDLFDMRLRVVHEWGAVPLSVFGILVAYGVVLISLLLFLGWLAYRRKMFQRGASM
jgi:ABC-type transport system involved in multi-copper enzyme maturation permease subunit